MANDWIVLACPGSGSTRDRLVANLLVYDVLHAAKARASMPPSARRPFLFNQNPERLSQATWNAVSTNRSHLLSTTVNAKAARMIGAEWGSPPAPEILTRLDKYTYLASVTVGTEVARPFLVHGIPANELHAEHRRPDAVGNLDAAIDQMAGRQPVEQRLATVDGHAGRIRDKLAKAASGERPPATPSGPHVVRVGGSTS
jgi:hypothetical protein